jgi:hypothetical protein
MVALENEMRHAYVYWHEEIRWLRELATVIRSRSSAHFTSCGT